MLNATVVKNKGLVFLIILMLLCPFLACTSAIPVTITQGLANQGTEKESLITHNFLSSWANIGSYVKDKKVVYYFSYVAYNNPDDENTLLYQASDPSATQSGNYSLKSEYIIIHFKDIDEATFNQLRSGNKTVNVDNTHYIVKLNIALSIDPEDTYSGTGTSGDINIYSFGVNISGNNMSVLSFSGDFDVNLGANDYIMGSFDSAF